MEFKKRKYLLRLNIHCNAVLIAILKLLIDEDMYVNRDIEKILLEASRSFQIITLYGSRQVGKTTTVEHLFSDEFEFVILDDADELFFQLLILKIF